jgi:hypothetical protein
MWDKADTAFLQAIIPVYEALIKTTDNNNQDSQSQAEIRNSGYCELYLHG